MKQIDVRDMLARNPAAKRDGEAIRLAQQAIKERRKAGFKGKTYDLAPPIGGGRRGSIRTIRRLRITNKVTFGA
jgi:hypothetical protein